MLAFDAASKLAVAGGRAKSDVANKLVSMALHKVSQRIAPPTAVRSSAYQDAVRQAFQNRCPYCGEVLREQTTVLEHLDAMNQFRAGLHVPGNVLPACRQCNLEKRRDDQEEQLPAGVRGWELFLQHDGTHGAGCNTCSYWAGKWPDPALRGARLAEGRQRIAEFRDEHLPPACKDLASTLAPLLQTMYEAAQAYADEATEKLVEDLVPKET